MPCVHNFGIIMNFDDQKDYSKLDEFGVFPDIFSRALQTYKCVAIDDDALNDWYPQIGAMKSYFHTYSRSEAGLARFGVTLIPPESLDLFHEIVKDDTKPEFSEQAAAVLSVIDEAKCKSKFVIHFGV